MDEKEPEEPEGLNRKKQCRRAQSICVDQPPVGFVMR